MVNPAATIIGAIPLAVIASALWIPHNAEANAPVVKPAKSHIQITAVSGNVAPQGKSHHMMRGKMGCAKRQRHKAEQLKEQKKKAPVEAPIDSEGILSFAHPDDVIPDSYIVVLREDAHPEALSSTLEFLYSTSNVVLQQQLSLMQSGSKDVEGMNSGLLETEQGLEIKHVHNLDEGAFRGFSGKFFGDVAKKIAALPEVAFVERDSIVRALKPREEDEAPWGLARVSHRKPLGLSTYNKYLYDGGAGEGVTSYIVDTGIYIDHEDFEGRARWGKTMPQGDQDYDAHGHGSHCAGTIGGSKYGVAKKADLVAVKVLGSDGSGTMSDVIGGVEYVVESHRKEQKEKGSKLKGSTANMSLGGGKSPSLDIAVNAATQAGVHFAVAAGNENQDACNVSPAGAEGAVTVGATDVRDQRAYFSNYGKCVDIFAPGVNVLSVGTYSPSSSATMSGTSMASPHIAGLLTYFVSLQPSSDSAYSTRGALTTKELKKHLIDFGTTGLVTDLDSESPNVIAFNGAGKDISDFWLGAYNGDAQEDDEEESHGHSWLESLEATAEEVAEYLSDVIEETQELVADLI